MNLVEPLDDQEQSTTTTTGGRGRRSGDRWVRLRSGTRSLFAPAPAPRPRGWRAPATGVAAVLAGTAVGLLRQPGVAALDTLWGEDGTVFLAQATRDGPLAAISTSYAGYYHLVPRLLAAVAAAAPADAAAVVLSAGAALCVALAAVLVYVASAGHLPGRLSRLIVAAVVVVVPLGQEEVLNSAANLHWYGLYALFWVLIWTPRGRAARVTAAVAVFLIAASDVLALAFLPLALVRAARWAPGGRTPGDRHGLLLAALLGLGLLGHALGLLAGATSRELDPDPVLATGGYLLRVVPATLLGQRWLGDEIDVRWFALAGAGWLLAGAAVALARVRFTRPAVPLAVTAGLHSLALFVLPVALTGIATSRYAVAPAMLLVTALVALLRPKAAGEVSRSRLPANAPLYALAALLTVVCATNLRMDNARAHGPRWSEELRAARVACAAGPAPTAVVPVTPANLGWWAHLPCDYLTR